jgi:hypothetical protein
MSEDTPAPLEPVPQSEVPVPRLPGKTPMFKAMHSSRYQRQNIMQEIDRQTKNHLICYVSSDAREIERDDTLGFVDLLHNIPNGEPIDLMLHTLGGDVDSAQALIELVHARIGDSHAFRVIVPHYAKSAGTLMALGAQTVVMSDSSELGMIDPQFVLKDTRGNEICTSVIAYLDAYREHSEAVRRDPNDPVAVVMLAQFDPVVVRKFQGYRDRTRDIAMRMLDRQGAASSKITEAFMDLSKWKSHGQKIGHGDAYDVGLKVEYRAPDDPLWLLYWELYCLQRLEVKSDKKIFESSFVSQLFEA